MPASARLGEFLAAMCLLGDYWTLPETADVRETSSEQSPPKSISASPCIGVD